jgi:hypothetical protein
MTGAATSTQRNLPLGRSAESPSPQPPSRQPLGYAVTAMRRHDRPEDQLAAVRTPRQSLGGSFLRAGPAADRSAVPVLGHRRLEPAGGRTAIATATTHDGGDQAAGLDNDCPFTEGVGVSGVHFSFDSGTTWMQPTFTGWSARNCVGAPGDSDPVCAPQVGPIGTLPGYFEAGLVSDGDPAVAFGPVFSNGAFSWANGSRLYYAGLTSNFPGRSAFKGFEALAVSRVDGPASTGLTQAIVSNQANWKAPVIVSKQNAALFSDKE